MNISNCAVLLIAMVSCIPIHSAAQINTEKRNQNLALKWSFQYDDQGRPARVTNPANKTIRLQYTTNKRGDVTGITRHYPDGSRDEQRFDSFGRLTELQEKTGTTKYQYDGFSRLTSVSYPERPEINYTYDALDRIKDIRIDQQNHAQYEYDFLGRLASMQTRVGKITYQYDHTQGLIERQLPNGVRTHWYHAPNGSLEKLIHMDSNNRLLMKFEYTWFPDGLIQKIIETTPKGQQTINYEYDTSQRLVTVHDSLYGQTDYAYDATGNRTHIKNRHKQVNSEYDWAGRLLKHQGALCSHDSASNLAHCKKDNRRFHFGPTEQLESVKSNHELVTYRHNAQGYLMERSVNGQKIDYLPDPLTDTWRPLWIRDSHGQVQSLIWDGDTLLGTQQNDTVIFYLHDHQGSVRARIASDGQRINTIAYQPFGAPRNEPEAKTPYAAFAGLIYDPVTQLYLAHARAYDPVLGRFLQIDPILRVPDGGQNGLSHYIYASNNPVNFVDLSGRTQIPLNPATIDWAKFIRQQEQALEVQMGKQLLDELGAKLQKDIGKARDASIIGIIDSLPEKNENSKELAKYIINKVQERTIEKPNQSLKETVNDVFEGFRSSNPARPVLMESITRALQPYVGKLGILTQNSLTESYQALLKDLVVVFTRFEKTSFKLAQSFTGRGQLTFINNAKASTILGAASGVFTSVIEGIKAGFTFLDITTRALMAFNMPTNLQRRTAWGWTGNTRREVPGGYLVQQTDLFTKPGPLKQLPRFTPGSIVRLDTYNIKTDFGTWNRRVTQETRASLIERFIFNARPFKYYYSPDTRIVDTTNSKNQYRVITRAGRKTFVPLTTDTSPNTQSVETTSAAEPQTPGTPPSSVFSPTQVGGVYLSGAAASLAPLGVLTGVYVDETTGRLALLTEKKGDITLPFRLDDLVTVFRCVYGEGAPFVSIDPIPTDPKGPVMSVRHSPCTQNSYVGWVLFESDRIMKVYSLGVDNVTRQPVNSQIPNYKNLLTLAGDDPDTTKNNWTRYWITPAQVKQKTNPAAAALTLLEVPLKVKAEAMTMNRGKLNTANATISKADRIFKNWFTGHYNDIGEEVWITPPAETGLSNPVPVFQELKRIASLTAIAERLLSQGVPLPTWIQDYRVQPVNIPHETPSIIAKSRTHTQLTQSSGTTEETSVHHQIYGGVQLAISDEDVHLDKNNTEIPAIAQQVKKTISTETLPAVIPVETPGTWYDATLLPGYGTIAVGAHQIESQDLVVQEQGHQLSLTRHFHSFFQPQGAYGDSWTLDLPRLTTVERIKERQGNKSMIKTEYRLSTPLGKLNTHFSTIKLIPELNSTLFAPIQHGKVLALAASRESRIPSAKHAVILRGGQRLLFNTDGLFVGASEKDFLKIYHRNEKGQINYIEGRKGDSVIGKIHLKHDSHGRLISATGSNQQTVSYQYDVNNQLQQMTTSDGVTDYRYRNGQISDVQYNGQRPAHYQYDAQGRLVSEKRPDGVTRNYHIEHDASGTRISATSKGQTTPDEMATFDTGQRPVHRGFADGSTVHWQYPDDNKVQIVATLANGDQYSIDQLENKAIEKVTLPEGGRYMIKRDEAGRVTQASTEEIPFLQQSWRKDGQLREASFITTRFAHDYDADGKLKRTVISAPSKEKKTNQWVALVYDDDGRTGSLSDYRGGKTRIHYDPQGRVRKVSSRREGTEYTYDKKDRLTAIQHNDGTSQIIRYDANQTTPQHIALKTAQGTASLSLDKNRIKRIQQFDGGAYQVAYEQGMIMPERLKTVSSPDGNTVDYHYDDQGRLDRIDVAGRYQWQYQYDNKGRLSGVVQRTY